LDPELSEELDLEQVPVLVRELAEELDLEQVPVLVRESAVVLLALVLAVNLGQDWEFGVPEGDQDWG
jgi:hypothetical protein